MAESVETALQERSEKKDNKNLSITAKILPADPDSLERKFLKLEERVSVLERGKPSSDSDAADKRPPIGMVLRGETKGRLFTLEVLEDGFLCSDGIVYPSLSAAAFGVSDNRRSGWKFWKDSLGRPVGEVTGRFRGA